MIFQKTKEIITKYALRHPFVVDIFKSFFSNKIVANSSVYKNYVLKKAKQYHLDCSDLIPGVTIEPTVNCNAKCIMCYHSKKQLNGVMDFGLFKKIVDDCIDNGIDEIGLSIYGEPLMDPLFFQRIEYLRKHDMKYLFFTNGSLLTDKKARCLFEIGGLKRINFSVSGYEKETYEKVMVHLNRDKTYKNILNFLTLKNHFKQNDLIVSISFVKTHLNYKDSRKFIKFWRKQQGVNHIVTADLWDRAGDADIQTIGKIGKMHKKNRWHTPCKSLWGTMYIYCDGRVAPCCDDADLRQLIIGDMNKQTLREVYTGATLQHLKKLHLSDKRHVQSVCGECTHNSVWI